MLTDPKARLIPEPQTTLFEVWDIEARALKCATDLEWVAHGAATTMQVKGRRTMVVIPGGRG